MLRPPLSGNNLHPPQPQHIPRKLLKRRHHESHPRPNPRLHTRFHLDHRLLPLHHPIQHHLHLPARPTPRPTRHPRAQQSLPPHGRPTHLHRRNARDRILGQRRPFRLPNNHRRPARNHVHVRMDC